MLELHTLGFAPFFENQLSADSIPARIAAEHRDSYTIWSASGDGAARLSGDIARRLRDEAWPGVGDWVTLRSAVSPDQMSIIDSVLSRRTAFIRAAAGRETRGQVIAANVDVVFIVSGLDFDFNPRRLQRYVARVLAGRARPVIVLNKTDLRDDIDSCIAAASQVAPGTPVVSTSAVRRSGLEQVVTYLGTGVTAALVGSSGAGKSSLINALLANDHLRIGEVRGGDSHGRHTTTHRQMLVVPSGGLLIDTPGMRELALTDDDGIDTVFSEIEKLAFHCRFRDCTHRSEPGCAVQRAVETGEIAADRLEQYFRLRAEALSYEFRSNERARRRNERAEGRRRASDLRMIRRWKGE
jgi:ribosome biogenesis GTPase